MEDNTVNSPGLTDKALASLAIRIVGFSGFITAVYKGICTIFAVYPIENTNNLIFTAFGVLLAILIYLLPLILADQIACLIIPRQTYIDTSAKAVIAAGRVLGLFIAANGLKMVYDGISVMTRTAPVIRSILGADELAHQMQAQPFIIAGIVSIIAGIYLVTGAKGLLGRIEKS